MENAKLPTVIRQMEERAEELAKNKLDLTSYRNERNLMLYPFCSTSKRKRINSIEYRSGDGRRWLEVTANYKYGMAKIWDFDILRFALSKAAEVQRYTGIFPHEVEFTAYECLKALNRDQKSGKNLVWIREALARLTSTTYRGNIFRDDSRLEVGFTLIGYEILEGKNGIEKIKIKFNGRLLESIRNNRGLLEIDPSALLEESGLKKRLLELVKVSKGDNKDWSVRVSLLKEMCAHEGRMNNFKAQLNSFKLPWKIHYSQTIRQEEKITFS